MKEDITNKTKSKLVVRLVEQGLKFTDYAINKHQSTFTDGQKSVFTKIINSGIKWLKINQSSLTKRKYFVQNFWFNEMSHYWTVGEFRLGVYGIKYKNKIVVIIIILLLKLYFSIGVNSIVSYLNK